MLQKNIFIVFTFFTLLSGICFTQWQPDVRLTNNDSNSATSFNNARCIAASGNVIHIIWFDFRDGNSEIYYKRSTDDGQNWQADTRLTYNPAFSVWPSLSVSDQVVHVIWEDFRNQSYDVYYKHSTDEGLSWGPDILLSDNLAGALGPSISVSGSVVHAVWLCDSIGEKIYYKRSIDNGINWGSIIPLTNTYEISRCPCVSVSGSIVHVVWDDTRNGNYEIYYKHSNDEGISWGADTRLTIDTSFSRNPSISSFGSFAHVLWYDNRDGNYEIYYKRSSDEGITWGADTRLTDNSAFSWNSYSTAFGNNLHVVWEDFRDGNQEIYYKRSTNLGLTWGSDTRLTNNPAFSWNPSITVSGTVVHIVWVDERDGNEEIYYKQNPTGNTIGIKTVYSELPIEFKLEQNYPNPFNPSTNIKFDIPKTSFVTIKIFNILGKEVAVLVNEILIAGTYLVDWSSENYSSGMYYLRLEAGDYNETKKMIKVK